MAQVKQGDTVKVHYTGKLSDGTVFDSSSGRDPLEFTMGEGRVIQGFENAVEGMSPGDSKTVNIPADQAYGPHDDKMMVTIDKNELPEDLKPKVGEQLQMRHPSGQVVMVTVADVSDCSITLDANHPLAGKDLTFDIQLVEIGPAA